MELTKEIKILWLCSTKLSDSRIKTTGSWVQPLANAISKIDNVKLINITAESVNSVKVDIIGRIKQYVLPYPHTSHYGHIANNFFCEEVKKIIDQENPDIIHIWGTESFWGSLYLKGYIDRPCLLGMQGVLYSYYYYYYGGLKTSEIIRTIRLKEILMPWRTIFNKKNILKKKGIYEKKLLSKIKYIDYQSEWVHNQVSNVDNSAKLFRTGIVLRDSFYKSHGWKYHYNVDPIVFTTASEAIPYKGIQTAIRALYLLKKKYPRIKLHIAGDMFVGNKLLDGFSLYLKSLIKSLDLNENIIFLGNIDEKSIVKQLQLCNVCVIPSYVESYCLAFAESMYVGTPTVVSYAGAMPEFAIDRKEALFYSPIDFITCAKLIKDCIENEKLSTNLSIECRKRRIIENDINMIVEKQINTYFDILN